MERHGGGITQPFLRTSVDCLMQYVIVHVQGREKRCLCFAKQKPGWARQKFLATTHKPYFSALYGYVKKSKDRLLDPVL